MTSFVQTRARNTDVQTSHIAASNATGLKAAYERLQIRKAIVGSSGLTGKEVASKLGMPFVVVSRRISEVHGIKRNGDRRDNSAVWVGA